MSTAPASVWVISDGRRGIENQALGLAGAINQITPVLIKRKIIGGDPSFVAQPPLLQYLRRRKPVKFGLGAPYPDIIIGCGRQAIAPMKTIKKASPNTFLTYIQDPRGHYSLFDLIIAPEHDQLKRANAISMIGAPTQITPQSLKQAAKDFAKTLKGFPNPSLYLIGGNSKRFTMSGENISEHIKSAQYSLSQDRSLLVSLSRRTPEAARQAWKNLAAQNKEKVWLYDPELSRDELNPYYAFLGAAQTIHVTQDSTNMLTGACYTGQTVLALPVDGAPQKFETLYRQLEHHGLVFKPDRHTYASPFTALAETERVAKILWNKYRKI